MSTPILDLLRDPSHWTIGMYARDYKGNFVSSGSPNATCWCLLGAIRKCHTDPVITKEIEQRLNTEIRTTTDRRGIVDFNDHATHEELITLLERVQV